MYLIFGSAFIIVAGLAAYIKSRKNLSHIVTEVLYELKYNALGLKALVDDFAEAKRNKIGIVCVFIIVSK